MISSRRLAREWALRLLYQCDSLVPVTRDIWQSIAALNAPDAEPTPDAVGHALYASRQISEREIFQRNIPTTDQAALRQILDEASLRFDALPKPIPPRILKQFLYALGKEISAVERKSLADEVEEAYSSTMTRLRREFVQRGSRTASGSPAEEILLEHLTEELQPALPDLTSAHFRPIVESVRALLSAAPVWQENALIAAFRGEPPADIKRRKPGRELKEMLTRLPVMLTPLLKPNVRADNAEIPTGTPRVNTPVCETALCEQLEMTLWERAFDFIRECVVACDGMSAMDARECVLARQRDFNAAQEAYWKKVSAMVEKQLGDWLLTATFTLTVARGAQAKQTEIDKTLTELASGWSLERQAVVDRNILRLAGYEMLFLPNIPAAASINEAVELAKKYSTAESGRFVNGVLGALAQRTGDKNTPAAKEDKAEQADIEEVEEQEAVDSEQ